MRASGNPGLPEGDPERAGIVTDILGRARRGDALTAIAAGLNEAGVRPKRGKAWTHTGIARLIASPALGGLIEVDGEFRKASFEGLVDPSEWRSTQQALRRRPRGERSRPRQTLSLLGGLLACAEHGHPCFAATRGADVLYQARVPGQCFVGVSRNSADDLITSLVVQRLRRPDAIGLFRPATPMGAVQGQLEEVRRRREEIINLLGDGVISRYEARPQLEALADRLRRLETQQNPAPSLVTESNLIDPGQAWVGWTTIQRREVLRLLFDRLAIKHVGFGSGPRLSPSRFVLDWASA